MMKTLSRLNPYIIIGVGLYILLFLTTRLINITTFPLYIDETTHIYVADLTANGQFFVGLSETAKQLYVWCIVLFFQLFDDPIFAARAVSVLAGLLTAGICYRLTEAFYPGRRLGYLAALFYLISPFALLYDRMALADSLLATLMGLSILLSYRLWQTPTLKMSLLLGLVFGLAVLNKAYAVFYYPTPLLLWLALGRQKIVWVKIVKLLGVTYATAAAAWLMIFTIGQYAYQDYLEKKSIAGGAQLGFLERVQVSAWQMADWLITYLTLPLLLLLLFVIIRMIIKRDRLGFILVFLVISPLIAFALAFTDLYSRYLLPIIVPVSVMIAWGIDDLLGLSVGWITSVRQRLDFSSPTYFIAQITLLLLFCIPAATFSYLILIRPNQAPFPADDKTSYIIRAQLPSGYREIADRMESLAVQHGRLNFLRNALPTPLEVILTVYLSEAVTERMSLLDIQDFSQTTPQALNKFAAQAPTLTIEKELITAGSATPALTYAQLWPLSILSSSDQTSAMAVYQWLTPPDFALRWLQQGGDTDPVIVWDGRETVITTAAGTLTAWPPLETTTPEAIQTSLTAENVEYILATPALIGQQPGLFAPFITTTTDGATLQINRLPPEWRLAFAYPNLNCQWCIFQLKAPGQPTRINFADKIELVGYDLSATHPMGDESLYVTLYWDVIDTPSTAYVVFVHLVDAQGNLVAQVDEPPLYGVWPTTEWRAGDKLADRHALPLPDLEAGQYEVWVGLYEPQTLERLSVTATESPVMGNAVLLRPLSVR